MRIAIGSDHGGYELKEIVKKHLQEKGLDVTDFGTNTTDSCDYPRFALAVSEAVAAGDYERGILICGTGIGISIAANKVPGIRCALVSDCFSAKATRQHNDTNLLALGGRVVGQGLALEIVDIWLNTEFEGGRHSKRVDLISEIEKKYSKE
ncbi:ribose 5-phosphate isomerase B [Alkaliphilus peptidifermentans]|uniref:Ribose 5-phosphate isomerase B n=1 Tax=Alkaliphilus peptidifermentans DSM 18978 TaxID=1120976 RepID=A0A1G5LA46_9FIRM|nr:ribose 5-phosphate isomerase B [Alkaliphilus peptidifermentans]SCZ09321.1 ribose 5-phosphate isomerase B [Alkaliphilus peptidifermentans DSM 18978]